MSRWFWVVDAFVVLSFVVIGRDNHGFVSGASDIVRIAAPFLIALAFGTVVLRAWTRPGSWLTGVWLGLMTLVLGMVLRGLVFDAGTARAFVIVSGAWFVGLMVAWRLVAMLVTRQRTWNAR